MDWVTVLGEFMISLHVVLLCIYLWWRQTSSSLGTHRKHGEFPGCAALTLWRWPEGVPLWPLQHLYQGRVDQRHLPLRSDVVTWEISARGRIWAMLSKKILQRSHWTRSSQCEVCLLQWFVHHAASPKTWLIQQHLCKVSHVSIHGTLIAAMKKLKYKIIKILEYYLFDYIKFQFFWGE